MKDLFFMLCWWVGVFACEKPMIVSSHGTFARIEPYPPPVARLEAAGRFVLFDDNGREIVSVNTKTGKVKLRGNPNEAAKRFWEAVELFGGKAEVKR